MKKHLKRFVHVSLVFFLSLLIPYPSPAAEPIRILIMPFDINAADDLGFLKRGIQDMLESRLGVENTITLVDTTPVQKATPSERARAVKADYVVTGSVTILGNRVSTDARCIDAARSKILLRFNRFGDDVGDALEHIDQFAAQVNTEILPQARLTAVTPTPPPAKTPPKAATQEIVTAKPKTVSPAPVIATTPPAPQKVVQGKTVAPSSATPAPLSTDLWKSKPFHKPIKGLAVGDVYGDNRNYAVIFADGKIFVYQMENGALTQRTSLAVMNSATFLGLDVADINQNGKAEIFVTALNPRGKLDSAVFEWNGKAFDTLLANARWYLRVIRNADGQEMLVGQKRGILTTGDAYGDVDPAGDLFIAGIHQLQWQRKSYQPIQKLNLPDWVNVFGFTYANLTGADPEMIAAFSATDRLRLIDADGMMVWESRERYGGNTIFLEYPSPASSNRGSRRMDRRYLPQRLQGADFNRDGRQELIVTRNFEVANRLLGRTREYNNSQLESLAWNQLAMTQQWNTDLITGYISDFAVGDLNNDGRQEIVFAVVAKTQPLLGKKQSIIITMDRPPQGN